MAESNLVGEVREVNSYRICLVVSIITARFQNADKKTLKEIRKEKKNIFPDVGCIRRCKHELLIASKLHQIWQRGDQSVSCLAS